VSRMSMKRLPHARVSPRAEQHECQVLHAALEDPAFLSPVFAALPAECLSQAACVCHAWAAAEVADRPALWRALVLSQWPGLAPLARPGIDWRKRYLMLLRNGVAERPESDPERYSFVFQGKWAAEGSLAFSHNVAGRKVAHSIQAGAINVTVQNALQFELKLPESIALPLSWQSDEGTSGTSMRDGLEILVLMHDASEGAVAHFLSFTVARGGIKYERPNGGGSVRLSSWWKRPLPDDFVAHVDTLSHPTHAGCGEAAPDGQRMEVPWVSTMFQDIDLSAMSPSPPTLEIHPLTLGFSMVEAAPRLKSITLQMVMQIDARQLNGNLVRMPCQQSQLEVLVDELDWA